MLLYSLVSSSMEGLKEKIPLIPRHQYRFGGTKERRGAERQLLRLGENLDQGLVFLDVILQELLAQAHDGVVGP